MKIPAKVPHGMFHVFAMRDIPNERSSSYYCADSQSLFDLLCMFDSYKHCKWWIDISIFDEETKLYHCDLKYCYLVGSNTGYPIFSKSFKKDAFRNILFVPYYDYNEKDFVCYE